ncbi:hypothetical protein N9755_01365 [bacterium]|nr:hypothetical protein [bacterium]
MGEVDKIVVSTLWFEKVDDIGEHLDFLYSSGINKLELTPFANFLSQKSLSSFYRICEDKGFQIVGWQGIFYGVNRIGDDEWKSRVNELSLLVSDFKPNYLCFGAPKLRADLESDIEPVTEFLQKLEQVQIYFEVLSKKFGGGWGSDATELLYSFGALQNFNLLYDSYGSTATDCALQDLKPKHLHVSSEGLKNLIIDKNLKNFLRQYLQSADYLTVEQMDISVTDMSSILSSLKGLI